MAHWAHALTLPPSVPIWRSSIKIFAESSAASCIDWILESFPNSLIMVFPLAGGWLAFLLVFDLMIGFHYLLLVLFTRFYFDFSLDYTSHFFVSACEAWHGKFHGMLTCVTSMPFSPRITHVASILIGRHPRRPLLHDTPGSTMTWHIGHDVDAPCLFGASA